MRKFIWQDQYKIGLDIVDTQHEKLFTLASQIIDTTDQTEITRLLMLFYQHSREHFKLEENFMKEIGYSGYQQHREAHDKMLDSLIEISKKIQSKKWNPADIQSFVESWVLKHILEEDLKLDSKLKNQAS